jgi:hypothetical protein
MRRLILPLLVLLAIVAGCGGSSSDDFQKSVVEARNEVDAALTHITDNPSGRKELLDRMDDAALRIDRAAEELDRSKAPDELDGERKQLVTAFRQLAVDLTQTADQIRQPGFEGLLEGTQGLSFQSWVDANKILQKLEQQGIDVQPLGRH